MTTEEAVSGTMTDGAAMAVVMIGVTVTVGVRVVPTNQPVLRRAAETVPMPGSPATAALDIIHTDDGREFWEAWADLRAKTTHPDAKAIVSRRRALMHRRRRWFRRMATVASVGLVGLCATAVRRLPGKCGCT